MRLIRWLLVLTVMSWAAAVAHGQTLADIARQERDRKKALQSKAVFTNASTGSAVILAATTAGIAKADETKTQVAVDSKGRDEKYWRAEFANARQNLKRADDKSRLTALKVTELSSQLLIEGRAEAERAIRADLDKAKIDQTFAALELQQAQQKLIDLDDELRRSRGLPGWAR